MGGFHKSKPFIDLAQEQHATVAVGEPGLNFSDDSGLENQSWRRLYLSWANPCSIQCKHMNSRELYAGGSFFMKYSG